MKPRLKEILEECPVVTAVKSHQGLEASFQSDCQIVFILYGTICDIASIVERIHQKNRIAIVHVDLIHGLDNKEIAVDFLKEIAKADGIISTKTNQIARARELEMYSIFRFFAIDSRSLATLEQQCRMARPDCIEILPGVMPQVLKEITKTNRTPLIAGGMIASKEDIYSAISAGATAVSTTKQELWFV